VATSVQTCRGAIALTWIRVSGGSLAIEMVSPIALALQVGAGDAFAPSAPRC